MRVAVHDRFDAIPAAEWNALAEGAGPFMRHEFLAALERHGCIGEHFGWIPQILALYDGGGTLRAAAPAFIKTNSYGEFVFDWSWADLYHRHGAAYYPKLVIAVPYTPVTGPRILARDDDARAAVIDAALDLAQTLKCSSLHCLFPPPKELAQWTAAGLLLRTGCQYHWHNQDYRDLDDFLAALASAKRKKIRRERRRVQEQGIVVELLHGDELEARHWPLIHRFYASTFERKGGVPTLSMEFFQAVAQAMPRQFLVTLARDGGRYVAGALFFRDEHALYGRHWGCDETYHSLHFEVCYYRALEYCIEQRLQRFEPGAQGEYKISRGFLPVPTGSAHWLADARFRAAIDHYLNHEREEMAYYMEELRAHSPFRHE